MCLLLGPQDLVWKLPRGQKELIEALVDRDMISWLEKKG